MSITEAGRALAARLPFEHAHGSVAAVRDRWAEFDAFVLFCATGIAVRTVGPLLADKRTDPSVVCVDDAGRFAIALCGAHERGGNDLARRVAAALGAEPVVTTAAEAGAAHARPPRMVVAGMGAASTADPAEAASLLDGTLAEIGLDRSAVLAVATIERRAGDPAIAGLGLPVVAYPPEQLATVEVPSPSEAVRTAVGTPSVAEAAALLAAGPGSRLVVPKRTARTVTVALAGRCEPAPLGPPPPNATRPACGSVAVVGLGPGDAAHRTAAAEQAVRRAEVVVGYRAYVELAADLIAPGASVLASPIGEEVDRATQALAHAAAGRRVALVCSGDAGVYGMASLVLELAPEVAPEVAVEIVPGVTAALAAAAALGAPLGHDHAVISLSDLLTPWSVIAARLRAAAAADLVVALYNPRSSRRTWQLEAARSIFLEHRRPETPVGIVTGACRPGATVVRTTLGGLDPEAVGMTSCVIVGASTTTVAGGRMVTPRGYRPTRYRQCTP